MQINKILLGCILITKLLSKTYKIFIKTDFVKCYCY